MSISFKKIARRRPFRLGNRDLTRGRFFDDEDTERVTDRRFIFGSRPKKVDPDSTFILLESDRKLKRLSNFDIVSVVTNARKRLTNGRRRPQNREVSVTQLDVAQIRPKKRVASLTSRTAKPKRPAALPKPRRKPMASEGGTMSRILHLRRTIGFAAASCWLVPAGGLFFLGQWRLALALTCLWVMGITSLLFGVVTWQGLDAGFLVHGAGSWPLVYLLGMVLLVGVYSISYFKIDEFTRLANRPTTKIYRWSWLLSLVFPGAGQLVHGHLRRALFFVANGLIMIMSLLGLYVAVELLPLMPAAVFGSVFDYLPLCFGALFLPSVILYVYGSYDAYFFGRHPRLRAKASIGKMFHVGHNDWKFIVVSLLFLTFLTGQLISGPSLGFYRQAIADYTAKTEHSSRNAISKHLHVVDHGLERLQKLGKRWR